MNELEQELERMSFDSVDEDDIAVTVSCVGMNNYYTVCPSEFKDFLDEHDEVTYVAFDWNAIPNELQTEQIDYDEMMAWFDSEQRDIVEILVDQRIAMSFEDADEMLDRTSIFNGSKEDYAREFAEMCGIEVDKLPNIIATNINWGDIFIDLCADGMIYQIRHDKFLTVNG